MPKLHPIVAQIRPSSEQLPAILSRDRDVVVTAGAGTGKTRTLVARYLALLAEGRPLRSIVAITFTKKAAREMRNRVRDEMRQYLERPKLDETERQRWLRHYGELDAARIGTIHSLCAEILRAHPAEARVDPHFEMLEEGQSNILRRQAIGEALAWAADHRQVVHLFALLSEVGLRDNLDRLIHQRLDAEEAFAQLPSDLLALWQDALARQQRRALDALQANPAWTAALDTLWANAASDPEDLLEIQRRRALAAIEAAVGPLTRQLASLAQLATVKLAAGRRRNWPAGREQQTAVKEALRTLRDLWGAQVPLLGLVLNPLDETLAGALPALQTLFTFTVDRYTALKRERSVLDFDDLEQGALMLLRQYAAARARWQEEVQAILVDEFQDTNARQRDLVKLLNGERGCLFIVGDEKQSIYAFRGADVTVFRQEQARIRWGGGDHFPLGTSYRAHRALIQGLNDLLRPVLGEEDPARPWAAPFAPLKHHRENPGPGFTSPHIELHLTIGSKTGGALQRAADALVKRLLELKESGAVHEYEDVAILCRASSSFGAYEDALDRAGVPFLTVAGRGFYDRPEIRDLLNALQALADPTDDLALTGLLRSPAFALSDVVLYRLCQQRDRDEAGIHLWDVLQYTRGHTGNARPHQVPRPPLGTGPGRPGPHAPLSPQDLARIDRAAGLISRLHDGVGRTSVADLLKALLDATDYRAALLQAGQRRGDRNVVKLLADAHRSGIVGVGEFLEYVAGLRESGAREGEARATTEGAVQIMSVHAAKGLEFPVVVIADATYSGPRRDALLIDPDLGVLLPLKDETGTLPAAYRLGQTTAADKEQAELDRLLYVAATRAREKLIFSACIGLGQNDQPSGLRGWLGQIAGPQGTGLAECTIEHSPEGASTICLELQVGQSPVAGTVYEPQWAWEPPPRREQVAPERPVLLPPPLLAPVSADLEQLDPRTGEQERVPPQRVWRVVPAVERPRAPAWVVGSLVHEALAGWRFPEGAPSAGPGQAPSDRSGRSFSRWAEARARGHGIGDPRQLADAVRRSDQLLRRFQGHALFHEMDAAERRLHEVPYSIEVDGRVESGIIDALYLREGSWTIVEFKTDRIKGPADLADLLERENYREQARRYQRAVERLLGQQPRVILCMLDYAGQVYLEG